MVGSEDPARASVCPALQAVPQAASVRMAVTTRTKRRKRAKRTRRRVAEMEMRAAKTRKQAAETKKTNLWKATRAKK